MQREDGQPRRRFLAPLALLALLLAGGAAYFLAMPKQPASGVDPAPASEAALEAPAVEPAAPPAEQESKQAVDIQEAQLPPPSPAPKAVAAPASRAPTPLPSAPGARAPPPQKPAPVVETGEPAKAPIAPAAAPAEAPSAQAAPARTTTGIDRRQALLLRRQALRTTYAGLLQEHGAGRIGSIVIELERAVDSSFDRFIDAPEQYDALERQLGELERILDERRRAFQ